jgi:4-hydroxybenzoate polyprenyltransferase
MGFAIGVVFTALTFDFNPLLGLFLMAASTMIAGLAYRRSTKHFPRKSGVRLKQVCFSGLAFLPLVMSTGMMGTQSSNPASLILLFAIGLSITTGILASGTRREPRI